MGELLVRRATAADAATLVAFNADVSRYQDAATPDDLIAAWTRDLMAGRHPRVDASDFVVTEDSRSGAIVSALALISQTWSYDGVDVEVGQPELVGTHPDYRGRGLIRRQFEVIHRWRAERGQKLLAIDGIPGFYRQFGYEMALELRGELSIDAGSVPRLNAVDPYRLRPAADADLAFIGEIYATGAARCLVTCPRDAALWRYELYGRSETNPWRPALRIVESIDKEPVGVLAHVPRLSGSRLMLTMYEVKPDISWHDVTPSVLRALRATGEAWTDSPQRFEHIGLCLGTQHPAYAAITHLAPRNEGAYAWYLRVPDLPDFLRHVAPVLERRLAASTMAGHTGELLISFYRDGLRLVFDAGRLTNIASWRQPLGLQGIEKLEPTMAERAAAMFPGQTFLQLLFG
ncbi:MAG TPA: GNAT family N-acetyltransferase [Candidatus Acidoferrales bacterium]|nr:GNAT family N-acetyltransferase [Candidatus Acidoferrales bacterium]